MAGSLLTTQAVTYSPQLDDALKVYAISSRYFSRIRAAALPPCGSGLPWYALA